MLLLDCFDDRRGRWTLGVGPELLRLSEVLKLFRSELGRGRDLAQVLLLLLLQVPQMVELELLFD